MSSSEGYGLPPQAYLPVGRQILPARQVDGDALLAGVGQGSIYHSLHQSQGL